MTDIQRHRGPDDQGQVVFSLARSCYQVVGAGERTGVLPFEGGVGFNRLSILDLSARGHQPMISENGRALIAFNGEIYNAFELRPLLEKKGFRFRSDTDTEVVLNLYLAFGQEGMLQRINGMFAICIIDLQERRVTLARDRLGIKPLYLSRLGRTLLFGSEVKSFLCHPDFGVELNLSALDEYVTFRYCAEGRHVLAGVEQIEPGQWMEISADGKVSGRRYWSIPDMEPTGSFSLQQAVDEAHARLDISVNRQLLSDVKLGCQLSGGIDSSIVNVLAAKHVGADLHAFSVIFDDPTFSEEEWIDQAAKTAGVVSHRYQLDASYFDEHMEQASWHLDQPLNHPNALGLMFLAENASRHVKVLLSGEGADEVLGGYPRYFFAMARPWVRPLARGLQHFPGIGKKVARQLGGGADPASHFVMASAYVDTERARRLKPGYRADQVIEQRRALFLEGRSKNHVANCLKYDMRTYLVDLLIRQDKMTMAFSLENRVPFLDHEWVEFVRRRFSVAHLVSWQPSCAPQDWVTRGTKVVLKAFASRYFDERFVFRKKAGFAIPLRAFFLQPAFYRRVQEQLLPSLQARGLFDAGYLAALWRRLGSISAADLEVLWVAFALESWLRQFERKGGRA